MVALGSCGVTGSNRTRLDVMKLGAVPRWLNGEHSPPRSPSDSPLLHRWLPVQPSQLGPVPPPVGLVDSGRATWRSSGLPRRTRKPRPSRSWSAKPTRSGDEYRTSGPIFKDQVARPTLTIPTPSIRFASPRSNSAKHSRRAKREAANTLRRSPHERVQRLDPVENHLVELPGTVE